MILDIIVHATLYAGILAVYAAGLSLIFGALKVFFVAYGAYYMLGSYIFYAGYHLLKLNLAVSIVLAVVICACLGVIANRLLVSPFKKKPLNVVLVTFALAIILEQVIILVIPPVVHGTPSIFPGSTNLFGIDVGVQRVATFIVGVVLFAGLWWFIEKTTMGKAILAMSQDEETAEIFGINTKRVSDLVLGLGGALAATSGVLISSTTVLYPAMGWDPLISSFSVVIVGGMGSMLGTLVGAFIVAFAQTSVAFFFFSGARTVISLILIAVILLARPEGIIRRKL